MYGISSTTPGSRSMTERPEIYYFIRGKGKVYLIGILLWLLPMEV